MDGMTSKGSVTNSNSCNKSKIRLSSLRKQRSNMKKNSRKKSKQSSKSVKKIISYEYELKSCLTWEYADVLQDIDKWHDLLKGADAETLKDETQLTSEATVDEVRESLMGGINTSVSQHEQNDFAIEDKHEATDVSTGIEDSPPSFYRCSGEVSPESPLETDDENSAGPSTDIREIEASGDTTKNSTIVSEETVRAVTSRELKVKLRPCIFQNKALINWNIIEQPSDCDNSAGESSKVNKNHSPKELGHKEICDSPPSFYRCSGEVPPESPLGTDDENFAGPSTDIRETEASGDTAKNSTIVSEETVRAVTSRELRVKLRPCIFQNRALVNWNIIEQPSDYDNSGGESSKVNKNHSPKELGHKEICSASSSSSDPIECRTKYKRNIRPKYSRDRPFECTECPKTFKTKKTLNTHQLIHSGEKPFECAECPKTFPQKHHLTIHQRVHSGEKPYKCRVCQQTFSQKSNLATHQYIHSKKRLFNCTECPKTFKTKQTLNTHHLIHSGEKLFECTECPKTFSWKQNLTTHQRTHSGEKPFSCTECIKSFSRKHLLTTHQRVHTGEKPFKCPHCVKTFTNSSNMKTHILRHHTDKDR